MSKMVRRLGWCGLLVVLALVAGSSAPMNTTQAGVCYGDWVDYYQTSACQVWVATKVACPGYPDQWDVGPGGSASPTPYSTTQPVQCPCPSGGGGGQGGGDTGELGPE